MADRVLIAAGDVIDVQLTSETVVMEGAHDRRRVEPGHITNRMRLFVRETDGKEKKYDFDDTELGVRETQRVAIVRVRPKGAAAPLNALLFNLSSGEQDAFEDGLYAHLWRKSGLAALWALLLAAAAAGAGYWVMSDRGGAMAPWLALLIAVVAFPLLWPIFRWLDRITANMRYRRARVRFIAEMHARVRAYAPAPASA